MTEGPKILYCHCAYAQVIPKETKQSVLDGLVKAQVPFDCVPDLCEMSARKDPILKSLAQGAHVRIAACYPRAVQGLFTSAGCPLPVAGPQIINMRVLSADEALAALLSQESHANHPVELSTAEGTS